MPCAEEQEKRAESPQGEPLREALQQQLEQRLADAGLPLPASGRDAGLLRTLAALYSHMLADTRKRLDSAPQKHRYALLGCHGVQHLPAHAGETVVVFQVAPGYQEPVYVPEGSLLSAQGGGEDHPLPVLFRTRSDFYAHPLRLTALYWADSGRDLVCAADPCAPVSLWEPSAPAQSRHLLELYFSEAFTGPVRAAWFFATLSMDGQPCPLDLLCDRQSFRWSLRTFGEQPGSVPLRAVCERENTLRLEEETGAMLEAAPGAALCLELLSRRYTGLALENPALDVRQRDFPPEAVVIGDRELDADSFYPFQNPMQPYEACFLFCGEALARRGAQVTLTFRLAFSVSEERLPESSQEIDYKWIMRRPQPKTEPDTALAYMRSTRWEYWNGSAFRELALGGPAFTEEGEMRLSFRCPEDLSPCAQGERTGYCLRLSCGACDELYALPRRVYTPRMERLRFSYSYDSPQTPAGAFCTNFGTRQALCAAGALRPYRPPLGEKRSLLLGFDRLPAGGRLQLFFLLPENRSPGMAVTCELLGSGGAAPCTVLDQTNGLRGSGILTCLLPCEPPEPLGLFGEAPRCWLRLSSPSFLRGTRLDGVYPNAQEVENRVRHAVEAPISQLSLCHTIPLPATNVVDAWVAVRAPESGDQWLDGTLFTVDYHHGAVELSGRAMKRVTESLAQGAVRVVYDTTDAQAGNVAAGEINRMQEELPFIEAVSNPCPVVSGYGSETNSQLARRTEDLLCCGGRATSPGDFERLAVDYCPLVRRARCAGGSPVRLAFLLAPDKRAAAPFVREQLSGLFARMGCTGLYGARLHIFEVDRVPLLLTIGTGGGDAVRGQLSWEQAIQRYLDPLEGGLDGNGWEIGAFPTEEQLASFVALKTQGRASLQKLELLLGKNAVALDDHKRQLFAVPGKATFIWRDSQC